MQRHRGKLTGGARAAAAPEPEAPEPEPSWTKDQIIEHYYEAYNNIGNVEKTWKQAREVDKSITKKDVQDWKRKNYAPLRAHRGLNSYVAKEPREEYQMDIMFLKDLEKEIKTEAPLYEAALLMVDIFTKYCWAEPIIGKDTKYVKKAITECMDKMGGKPKMIYHDAETTFTGDPLQQWLVKKKIKPITTLTHAPVAERTIRTIKNLLYPRVRHFKSPWWRELPKVLDIYNNDKHRSTGFTPNDARNPENQDDVRLNLDINRKRGRRYDPIEKGDRVRVVRKKEINEKENKPPFYDGTWKVEGVENKIKGRAQGVPIITVDRSKRPLPARKLNLMRHEAVVVPR
jgi:hypothetical protein